MDDTLPAIQQPDNLAKITAWHHAVAQKRFFTAEESRLRSEIFGVAFPDPVEGTNRTQLLDNWSLKGVYSLKRDIDIGPMQLMRPKFEEAKIDVDSLFKQSFDLSVSTYRYLTDDQMHLVDQVLIIKPGSVTLELEPPKNSKK